MLAFRRQPIEQILSLTLEGMDIPIIKKRVKNINIRIDRQGNVKVSAPFRCSLQKIRAFLMEKEQWIAHHVTQIKAQPKLIMTSLQSGETTPYLGQVYPLKIYQSERDLPHIHFENNQIACFIKPSATHEDIQSLLLQWHRAQLKTLLPDLITKWEPIIGVQIKEWGVRVMTSRWGSCNTIKKRIWLNVHLMQKPLVCLEYVVVHEMVHLLEASHNRRFHALMSQFMPEWTAYERLLKNE